MQCLYEVLGVSRDSSQEEIRSAYKRLALQLHPDKLAQSGASGGADATAAFQELLHAYEVLSDPKERAWYDSHRSQILFSDPSSASKSRSSFFDLDLFSFFSKSVYSGYTDSGKGFFKVYGDLFAKIYAQELHFAEKLGLPSDEVAPAPLIGNLDSPYSQVTAFYGYWLGYTTILDFSWADEHDSFSGPNRKWRRLMEEENKKSRKKAKREHIDTVRGLAAFVKKRDKRVLDMQMKKKQEDEKRQADEMKRRKEEERKRKEKAMMYQECEWVKNDDEEIKMSWDEEEEEIRKKKNDIELYCVACNKKFKSDKQWKNHEQSKKHREKIAELRSTFDEEEDTLKDVGQAELCASFDYEPQAQEDETSDNDSIKISKALKKDLNLTEEADGDANKNIVDLPSNAEASGPANDYGNGNNTEYHTLRNRKSRRAKRETRRQQLEVRDGRGGINGSQEDDNEVHDSNVGGHLEDLSYTFEDKSDKLKGDQAVHSSQNHKKVELNGIELAKKETTPAKNSLKGKKQKAATKEPNNSCGTCGEIFDSRNKLFAHLSNTGHAKQKSW